MNLNLNRTKWTLDLSDTEVIAIFSMLIHCKNNNIHATQEEKISVVNWLEDKVLKEQILDREIEIVKRYENTNASKTDRKKKRNNKSKAKRY